MKNLTNIAVFASLAFYGLACRDVEPRVRSPHWNKDTCDECRMALTVPRYAVQIVGPGARVAYFDDLGCAVAYQESHPEVAEGTFYVLAPGSQEAWVPADEIRFAEGFETPMDYGLAPQEGGPFDFEDVRTKLLEQRRARRHNR